MWCTLLANGVLEMWGYDLVTSMYVPEMCGMLSSEFGFP